jgi:putative colanic acid biosynthesis glycosyltransferase
MTTKTLSIITVTLNNLSGLTQTAASINAQTDTDFEWIIIDGGSTDGTLAFLKPQSALWQSAPDNGIYDAMNKGIAAATAPHTLFLNAGDTFTDENTLALINQHLKENPKTALLYGDSWEDQNYKPARPHTAITRGLFTHHQAIIYSRKALGAMRYNLDYDIAADYDLTARILTTLKPEEIHHLPRALCIFESGGISQTQATTGRREQYQIRARLKLCSPLKNKLIYAAQTLLWNFRRVEPNLYWHLKSSDNTAPETAQNQTPPPRP